MSDTKNVQPVPEYELPAAPEMPELEPAEERPLIGSSGEQKAI